MPVELRYTRRRFTEEWQRGQEIASVRALESEETLNHPHGSQCGQYTVNVVTLRHRRLSLVVLQRRLRKYTGVKRD